MKAHHEAWKVIRIERYGGITETTEEEDLEWWKALSALNP